MSLLRVHSSYLSGNFGAVFIYANPNSFWSDNNRRTYVCMSVGVCINGALVIARGVRDLQPQMSLKRRRDFKFIAPSKVEDQDPKL